MTPMRIVQEPRLALVAGVLAALALALACGAGGATAAVAKPVSANGRSYDPSISADGRFVAFDSTASNLVRGDTNGYSDVFVRDRLTGTTERVSVNTAGKQADDMSDSPSISADGRFVFFDSMASNLVAGDTNDGWDVFVRDRLNGTTRRVTVSSAGKQGNNWSYGSLISPDGRFVAFTSYASNLVAGDRHGYSDVFVRDQLTGTTERVSVSSSGRQGRGTSYCEGISSDGRFITFASWAPNLVAGDTNRELDVFVRDRLKGTTERVSVAGSGEQAQGRSDDGSTTDDGRFVIFHSNAPNLVAGDTNKTWDVFVRDRLSGTTERVSLSSTGRQGNGRSNFPGFLSEDGRFVAFDSTASNLVARDTNGRRDVFVRDRLTGTTERVSLSSAGRQGNGPSLLYASTDRFIGFVSKASNLVAGDTNKTWDVFLRDQLTGTTELVSVARVKR